MSDDFKKNLMLIVGATTILILIFIVSSSLISNRDFQSEVVTSFQVTTDVAKVVDMPEEEIVINDTSSIDAPEVVQQLQQELSENKPGRRTERVLTEDNPNFTIDDLSHLDLGFNQPVKEKASSPAADSTLSLNTQSLNEQAVTLDPDIGSAEYLSISNTTFQSCGELVVPSGFGLAVFALTAGSNPTIECLGEAVATPSCGEYSAQVVTEGSQLELYVGSRPDDAVCATGASLDGGFIVLCSVEKLMDVGSGEDKTFAQWQYDFKNEPGDMFAKMYFDNKAVFENSKNFKDYDCKVYES